MHSSFWRVTFNFSISSRAGLLRGWSGRSSSSSWQPWTCHLCEGVPQYPVSWSPSSSIISTSCWEDLLEYSSWDTSRLSCQQWRDNFSAFENDCLQSTINHLLFEQNWKNRTLQSFIFRLLFIWTRECFFFKLRLFWRFLCRVPKFSSNL